MKMNLNEIGEFGLIEKLRAKLKNRGGVRLGIGDDAALLESLRAPLVTTDCLVEDVHFRRDWTSARALGIKAIAVNVSDIAAMGGKPVAAFVSLALGARDDLSFVEELYEGMESACQLYDLTLCGGDFSRSPGALFLNVTIVGDASTRAPILRNGAQNGDAILVTGTLGDSAAGLAILQSEEEARAESASTRGGNEAHLSRENQPRPTDNFEENALPHDALSSRGNRNDDTKNRDEKKAVAAREVETNFASTRAEAAALLAREELSRGADARDENVISSDAISARETAAKLAGNRAESAAASARETAKSSATRGENATQQSTVLPHEMETDSASTRDVATLSESARDFLLQRHFEPAARTREIEAALQFAPTAIHAALDLSDGIVGDAAHIARASNLSLRIETARLPLSQECREAARVLAQDAENWALSGGEDYELLLCVAPENAEKIASQIMEETGTRATVIGHCFAGENPCVLLVDERGESAEAGRAFTHF